MRKAEIKIINKAFTIYFSVGYSLNANGGYRSVVNMKAYTLTLSDQRMTPTTKSNIPLGYFPVNSMANQEMIVQTTTAT
jgi:hypothetical protein